MRLAFLTHEPFYPPSGGGSAEAVYLVQEFVRRGHEVHLFCPRVSDPAAVRPRFGVQLHEFTAWPMGRYAKLRNFKYLLFPFFLQRLVERNAREVKFDLVFSQHAISAVTAGRLKRRLGLTVVMNFLDYLTGFMQTWPPYLAPPPLLKQLNLFELSMPRRYSVDGVLTVSDTLADYFAEAGFPRERILPIYYGYDSDLFPFRGEQPGPRGDESPVIVMHGSLDHHHLRAIALEAMARVVQQRPATRLRIVGHQTGALQKFLSQARGRIPARQIECTGFVPYDQVAKHLASASVGIVPYEESAGTHCAFVAKIVEYLGVGLPVVSTPLDSARRYFGSEPCVRFARFNGKDFAQQILGWLEEKPEAWTQRAQAAGERVKAELDWRAISRRAVEFTEQVLKERRTS